MLVKLNYCAKSTLFEYVFPMKVITESSIERWILRIKDSLNFHIPLKHMDEGDEILYDPIVAKEILLNE